MSSYYEPFDLMPQHANKIKFLPRLEGMEDKSKENETPIFSKRKMTLKFPNEIKGEIMHLTVSRNWLICILNCNQKYIFYRFFLLRAMPPGEIYLDKYLSGYKITKIFLDPTGYHTLISLVPDSPGLSADFLYIHGNGPKVRRIERFKDHEITSVAFNNFFGTETSTGPILLGTSKGLIFETELSLEAEKQTHRRQVYDLGLGRPKYPLTGIEILKVPESTKYMVIVTASDFIYTFQETLKPDEKFLQPIFDQYEKGILSHTAEECVDLNFSVLRLYGPPSDKYPNIWAWLCGSGIRNGEISSSSTSSTVLLGDSLISLDFEQNRILSYDERRSKVPKTFVLTEFHILLLYNDHVTGICLLNQAVVYEEYFHEQMGELLNIVRDPFSGSIYLYTEKHIFTYKITDEKRNIWKIYLDMGSFDTAATYAIDSPKDLDKVLIKQAEHAYSEGCYEEAALIYVETKKTFQEVSLKLLQLENKRPMILYSKKYLKKLDDHNDKHIKVIVIMLIDIYLTQINDPAVLQKQKEEWQNEFEAFLKDPRVFKCAQENRQTVQDLITQHADSYNLSQFAIANSDYEEVIRQQIISKRYKEALKTLTKQKNDELYYKYCPLLMEQMPRETLDTMIGQNYKLKPERLIPTLIMLESPKHIECTIKYLEYAVYNLGDSTEALHNFLIKLYAEHLPSKLITYLRNEGNDISLVHYDVNYALEISMEHNVQVACVFLQCLLQMWNTAVDLALSFDMNLAKETASKPPNDETQRKLWLRIAHHDIQGTNDVKKALNLLEECKLLRIEDLLPFFSDFEKIDDFKTPICKALQEYNKRIQELQQDMLDTSKQAERVRNDLQNVRSRSVRIRSHDLCSICEQYLLMKPFFIFICGHKYHTDCLEKQVKPMLSSDRSRKLTMLKQNLESIMTQAVANGSQGPELQKKRDKIKKEVEEILGANCLNCGLLIRTIDQPFVDDWDQVNVDWE